MKILKKDIILVLIIFIILLVGCNKNYTVTLIHNENITKVDFGAGNAFYYDEIYEEGYLFFGWYDNEGVNANGRIISEDVTFIGKYIQEGTKYKIEYQLNGGELRGRAPIEYEVGTVLEIPSALPVGNIVFIGWYLNGELITEINPEMYGDILLEAKWEDHNIYHTINYNLNGGIIEEECINKYREGVDAFSLPIPKKEGYLFKGWYTDNEYTNRLTSITRNSKEDYDLYAKFEEKTVDNIHISFLGDSITTFANNIPTPYPTYYPAGDVDGVEDTWWYQVVQNTGFKLLMNNSSSGSQVTSGSDAAQTDNRLAYLEKDNKTPDILVIYMGTNDLTRGIASISFKNAYITMINKIREKYDDVEIYIINLPSNTYQNDFETRRREFNGILLDIANEYKLTYIDAAKAINEDNVKECMYAGAHLNSKGMKILSDLVSQIINEREK